MGIREVITECVGIERDGYGMNRSCSCSQRDRGKLSGGGEGEPQPASGRVDKGREVSSTIEEERDKVVERVVASLDMVFSEKGTKGKR